MGFQGPRGLLAAADRSVDVGEEIGGMGGIEVSRLGGIDNRTAADRYKAFEIAFAGKVGRGLKRYIGRLDSDLILEGDIDPGVGERPLDGGNMGCRG